MPVEIIPTIKMSENNTTDQGAPADTSISATVNAAAHAYEVAMVENTVNPTPVAAAQIYQQQQSSGDGSGDVVMSDRVPSRHDVRLSIPASACLVCFSRLIVNHSPQLSSPAQLPAPIVQPLIEPVHLCATPMAPM